MDAKTNKNWRKCSGIDYRGKTGLLLDRKMHLEKMLRTFYFKGKDSVFEGVWSLEVPAASFKACHLKGT